MNQVPEDPTVVIDTSRGKIFTHRSDTEIPTPAVIENSLVAARRKWMNE